MYVSGNWPNKCLLNYYYWVKPGSYTIPSPLPQGWPVQTGFAESEFISHNFRVRMCWSLPRSAKALWFLCKQ